MFALGKPLKMVAILFDQMHKSKIIPLTHKSCMNLKEYMLFFLEVVKSTERVKQKMS